MAFDPGILPQEQTLFELELNFSEVRELEVVNQILPGARVDLSSPYQNTWTNAEGSCTVDLSGAFSVELRQPLAEDPLSLLESVGFEIAGTQRSLKSMTLWQKVMDATLLTPLRVNLENDQITGMEGYFLLYEGDPVRTSQAACCSAADALVVFVANRDSLGWVGGAVTALEQGYVPALYSGVLRLKPVWRIITDTATYEVDGLTRNVYLVE